MKITIVCDITGAQNNSADVAAMNLIRGMKKRGHEVVVVCADEFKEGREGYVVVPRLGGMVKNEGAAGSAGEGRLEAAVWDSDMVHIMTTSALGAVAAAQCRRHCIPFSADYTTQAQAGASRPAINSLIPGRTFYRYLYNRIYRYADAVRFPNEAACERFTQAAGHQVNAYIIPDGVGERFVPNGAKKPCAYGSHFVITYCAPYRREKAHDVLIDAVALSKYNSSIQLILAGDGYCRRSLMARADKLVHRPVFAAFPHNLMPNVLNYSDLYVHPAEVDVQATACMEALACGKVPVIADSPRSDAVRFALDEGNLFKNGDAQDLADKIDRFIEDPALLTEYRERYKGIAAAWSQEACMDRMEEMFCEISG